jgi:hypothetical protein
MINNNWPRSVSVRHDGEVRYTTYGVDWVSKASIGHTNASVSPQTIILEKMCDVHLMCYAYMNGLCVCMCVHVRDIQRQRIQK